LFGELTQTLNGPDVQAALQKGADLLSALRSTGTLSQDTQRFVSRGNSRNIDPQRMESLKDIYTGLASRSVNERLKSDAELSNRLREDMEAATKGLNPDDVFEAFRLSSDLLSEEKSNEGLYMPFEEVAQKWFSDQKGVR